MLAIILYIDPGANRLMKMRMFRSKVTDLLKMKGFVTFLLEGKDRIDFLNKHGIPLHNVVFLSKFAAFTDDEKSGIMNALRQTRFAMPAVFELSS